VSSGGYASDTTINAGGVQKILFGGYENDSLIYGSGIVSSGGAAYDDTIASGGVQTLHGIGGGAIVLLGGIEKLVSGGSEGLSQIYGKEVISDHASGHTDTVYSGGVLNISSGGFESFGIVMSGGKANVSSGGTISAGTIEGTLTVSSGGFVSGGLIISGGGTAKISGTVSSGQGVVFDGAGDLALYDLAQFHATIGGFSTGDKIDLGGFTYGAGEVLSYTEAASLISGTLNIVDGAQTAKLTLLGNYTSSDFALADDPQGGTFVKFV
jgi:autotransporter passenger strand-loop-strand repeat protein